MILPLVSSVLTLGLVVAVVLVVVAAVAFPFKPMHLGDDVAAGLGVRFARVRAVLLLCAVLLAAVGVFLLLAFVLSLALELRVMHRWIERPILVVFPLAGAAACAVSVAPCGKRLSGVMMSTGDPSGQNASRSPTGRASHCW